MTIQVNSKLTKSRNPVEHGYYLENKIGNVIQLVGDGWCLVEFAIRVEARRIDRVKRNRFGEPNKRTKDCLQWYVHDTDFFLK
jgi:hypothetical protein